MTTHGPIHFHEWLGDSWGLLFSHHKDFTPVCTTELSSLAQRQAEFDQRDVKLIGLSIDELDDHFRWLADISEITGRGIAYPIIADEDGSIAERYDMMAGSRWAAVGVIADGPLPLCHRSRQKDPGPNRLSADDRP